MKTYGFPWPTMLDCDKFPLDNDMCISSQSDKEETDGRLLTQFEPSQWVAFMNDVIEKRACPFEKAKFKQVATQEYWVKSE